MAAKYFTVEQANKTLPLVERIVADIRADYDIWRDRMRRYELLSAEATDTSGEAPEQIALREEVDAVAHRINGYMEELSQIGCIFKGFDTGLVDFHGTRDGRDIYFCWKYGEPAVSHWHELDAGYSGRQPLEHEPISEDS